MRVFDFDETIYNGDSTVDFYKFCLKKYPYCLKRIAPALIPGILLLMKKYDKTKFKQKFYRFLLDIPDIDKTVEEFWDLNISKIKSFYKSKEDDVIISASPKFLLAEACKRLGIIHLLASEVNKKTGDYTGVNCYGEEKVKRLNSYMKDYVIDEFYSDSYSDTPLANLAKKAYLVKGNQILPR